MTKYIGAIFSTTILIYLTFFNVVAQEQWISKTFYEDVFIENHGQYDNFRFANQF